MISSPRLFFFFFFNDTATTEIYTLSLHDALPIYLDYRCLHGARNRAISGEGDGHGGVGGRPGPLPPRPGDHDKSGERRGGGEGRTPWLPHHFKKKNKVELFACYGPPRAGYGDE